MAAISCKSSWRFSISRMVCPLCGDECNCSPASLSAGFFRHPTRPRFEPDTTTVKATPPEELVDPEAFDASEQQFEASLRETPRPRFVVQEETPVAQPEPNRALSEPAEALLDAPAEDVPVEAASNESASENPLAAASQSEADFSFWRQEVAARVDSYRARRKPREPRYPSLKLPFENAEALPRMAATDSRSTRSALALESAAPDFFKETNSVSIPARAVSPETARVIEFPRHGTESVPPLEELADPVMGRPRIVEAPELLPPPPMLGGMVIEQEDQDEGPRPGIDVPLQAISVPRRVAAAVIDAAVVLAACTMFGYIFFKVTLVVPPWRSLLTLGLGTTFLTWATYQYLLLVHCGTTPGLRLAGLRMNRFDGTPASRNLRRWRVLASILSAASLGLGYLWSFLDEDRLCWHDRITKTHLGKCVESWPVVSGQ